MVYQGSFARFYDVFYADKPYDREVAFVDGLLREHGRGPSEHLLDIACGTGRHSVGLADLGWTVVGVDRSAEMLTVARQRVAERSVTFVEQDMRRLDLESKAFDAAVCLFDSIGYAVSNDGVLEVLAGVRRHLRAGGLFAVEFWHAPPMLRAHDPVRAREWETDGGTILRVSRTSLEVERQVARVEYTVYELRPNSTFEASREVHENRFFLVQEMDVLLRSSDLEPIAWYAGFDASGTIDESTWHVVALCRAGSGPP